MIVLASTSRYRKALLERLGISFDVEFPDCDERKLEAIGGHSGEIALRLAHAKAASVRARRRGDLVIGSDQFVVCDGEILHKPVTPERACQQLHEVKNPFTDAKPGWRLRSDLRTGIRLFCDWTKNPNGT